MVDDIKAYDGPIVTRVDAQAAGLDHWFSGKQCKAGHLSERYTKSGHCISCALRNAEDARKKDPDAFRAAQRLYYSENKVAILDRAKTNYAASPDHRREYAKKYYAKNSDKRRAYSIERRAADPQKERDARRARYVADPGKVCAAVLSWQKANPEKKRALNRLRRSRSRGAEGKHTAEDILWLMGVQGSKCAHSWCRKDLKKERHVDHVIPLSRGGSNDRKNIALLCPACNMRKHNTHPIDFAQQNGMLL